MRFSRCRRTDGVLRGAGRRLTRIRRLRFARWSAGRRAVGVGRLRRCPNDGRISAARSWTLRAGRLCGHRQIRPDQGEATGRHRRAPEEFPPVPAFEFVAWLMHRSPLSG